MASDASDTSLCAKSLEPPALRPTQPAQKVHAILASQGELGKGRPYSSYHA